MNQLWLLLGLKPDSFVSGLKRAKDEQKAFEKNWKDLSKLFQAGGITFAVIQFFQTVIEQANNAKGAIDENTAAVQRFGKTISESADKGKNWGVQFIGWLNRIGEGLGNQQVAADKFFGGLIKVLQAPLGQVSLKSLGALWDASKKAAQDSSDAADNADAQERALAQLREKFGADLLKVNADIAAAKKRTQDIDLKGLTAQERVNQLENEYIAAIDKANEGQGSSVQKQQQALTVINARNALMEAQNDLVKDNAASSKKAFDEDVEWYKKQAAAAKEHQDYLFEQKDLTDQIVELEARRAALVKVAADDAPKQVELDKVDAELKTKIADQAERAAAAADKARKASEGQAKAVQMTQDAYAALLYSFTNGGYNSQQIQDANDDALKEAQRRNRLALDKIGADSSVTANPGGGDNIADGQFGFNVLRLQNENARIQRELDARNNIRDSVSALGLDGARRAYSGDPLIFDKLAEQFTQTQTKTDKTNSLLDRLVGQLDPTASGDHALGNPALADTVALGFEKVTQQLRANGTKGF